MQQPPITVICGLIRNQDQQYFIARRAAHKEHAGFWEFPGGKLEANESHEKCLQRELMEELGMTVKVGSLAGETTHDFDSFSIHLIAYHCELVGATYELTDHDRYEWVASKDLLNYQLAASDVVFAHILDKGY